MTVTPSPRSALQWTRSHVGSVLGYEAMEKLARLDPGTGDFLSGFLASGLNLFKRALPVLREACERRDYCALAFEAHRVRSAAGHLGARRLLDLCATFGGKGQGLSAPWDDQVSRRACELVQETQLVHDEIQRLISAPQ